MKKKLLILTLIFVVVTSITVSGLSIIKKNHSVFYKRHFAILDAVFMDDNILQNYEKYVKEKKAKKDLWNHYYNLSLRKNAKHPLEFPTYDGSGQAVHPDIAYVKEGFGGTKYWLAFTPYPYSKEEFENPSILVSEDGQGFREHQGLKNPIVPPPENVKEGGHLSDTDIVLSDGNLEVYYVYNKRGVPGPSKFYKTKSRDGIQWSKPELIYESVETVEGYSPAVIKEGKDTRMWYVGGEGNFVYTDSKDGEKSWEKVRKCELNLAEWKPWHVDVIKTDEGYEGLLSAKSYELNTRALFYISSKDGLKWEVAPRPLLFPRDRHWDSEEIYRSTLIREEDKYRIWYSARDKKQRWKIGYTEVTNIEINNLKQGFQ